MMATQESIGHQASTAAALSESAPLREATSASLQWRSPTMSSSASLKHAPCGINRKPGLLLPLSIPTKHEHLLSGFSYHQDLFDLHISPKQWDSFNDDIQKAMNPGKLDRVAARLSKRRIPPMSPLLITAASIKAANKRAIERRVLQSLQEDVDDEMGELAATIKRWNEDIFASLGLEVNIRLTSSALRRTQKEEKKRKKKEMETRAKYGAATHNPNEGDEVQEGLPEDSEAGNKYQIVITGLEPPPLYEEANMKELPGEEIGRHATMLDGKAVGGPVEMPGQVGDQVVELPAPLPAPVELAASAAIELPGS